MNHPSCVFSHCTNENIDSAIGLRTCQTADKPSPMRARRMTCDIPEQIKLVLALLQILRKLFGDLLQVSENAADKASVNGAKTPTMLSACHSRFFRGVTAARGNCPIMTVRTLIFSE